MRHRSVNSFRFRDAEGLALEGCRSRSFSFVGRRSLPRSSLLLRRSFLPSGNKEWVEESVDTDSFLDSMLDEAVGDLVADTIEGVRLIGGPPTGWTRAPVVRFCMLKEIGEAFGSTRELKSLTDSDGL